LRKIAQVEGGDVWKCVYTPQRPRRRPAARWSKTFARFLFQEPRCLARTDAWLCYPQQHFRIAVDNNARRRPIKPLWSSFPELRVRLARQRRDMSSCENSSQVADQSASHSRTFEW